jgi:hypothetical protein
MAILIRCTMLDRVVIFAAIFLQTESQSIAGHLAPFLVGTFPIRAFT